MVNDGNNNYDDDHNDREMHFNAPSFPRAPQIDKPLRDWQFAIMTKQPRILSKATPTHRSVLSQPGQTISRTTDQPTNRPVATL